MAKTPKPKRTDAPIRLALRIEDGWWVAYMAPLDTMENAVELGRINYNAARAAPDGEARWKLLMVDVLGACLRAAGVTPVAMEERKVPK
jgi:hypothetical protein